MMAINVSLLTNSRVINRSGGQIRPLLMLVAVPSLTVGVSSAYLPA